MSGDGDFLHHEPGFPPMVEGWSTNDYTAELMRFHGRQRHSYQAKGKVLLLPRTGLLVVPYEMTSGAGWNVVVVRADAQDVYQPDGYSLYVGDQEIETAVELDVTRAMAPTTTAGEGHPLADMVNGPSPGGFPEGTCWICGDPTDHNGHPHSRVTGDGLDRYAVAAEHLRRRFSGPNRRGFFSSVFEREAEASVRLDGETQTVDRGPVVAPPPLEQLDALPPRHGVLGELEQLLDAVIPAYGRPVGSVAVPTVDLVRWRDQLRREDDQDGQDCLACADDVIAVGPSGLCAGCEAEEASWRVRIEQVATWLERLAAEAEDAPGKMHVALPDGDHLAAAVRVDALRAHVGELRLLRERPL